MLRLLNTLESSAFPTMTPIQTVQMLAAERPRVWRKATKTQRHEILATYEQTQSVRKAFANVKAGKVTTSDLEFHGQRYGGGR